MCRMLALQAPTIKQAQELLAAFRKQAHEAKPWPDGTPSRHTDGYGIVAAAPGELRFIARRPSDAMGDPNYERSLEALKNAPKNAVLLCHLRAASAGSAQLENTHPFVAEGWAFSHNGTIKGHLNDPGVAYRGQTDSERFFRKFLKHLKVQPSPEDALRRCILEIEAHCTYSSLTCLFTDGTTLYGYRRVGTDLEGGKSRQDLEAHYTLGFGKSGRAMLVAQELTHLGAVEGWQEIPDDGLLVWKLSEKPQVRPLGLLAKAV